jgi:thioredoxin reductase
MKQKLAILGAGPIGLEAALAAHSRGYDVKMFERREIADSVRQWGHIRMFSPFAMNVSVEGIALLRARGIDLPNGEEELTGSEFVDRYLAPLAAHLGAPIYLRTEVVAIARDATRKNERIGDPERAEIPFRLLVRRDGNEYFETADLIFDCTGTFCTPNPLGDAGIPALGESAHREFISYGIPDVRSFAGKRLLVVGDGHSAATVVRDLSACADTEITWAVRKAVAQPCPRIPNDPLAARDALAVTANELVSGRVRYLSATTAEALARNGLGLNVTLRRDGKREVITVDHVIAATGFRPDMNLARELQVQTCWATEGTYKLAAALLGETGGDCLAVGGFGAESLVHPEPGYFTLGMKSYGRTSDFLIRTGLEQVASLLDWLAQKRE